MADRDQPRFFAAQVSGDIPRNCARDIVCLCRFLHAGRDIDRGAVDPDGTLGVALLADHDFAAMDSDPEGRDDAKLLQVLAALSPYRRKDGVNRPQDPVIFDRLAPIPQRIKPSPL